VDRPHPGHRRHGAGSITVEDLLSRERVPHRGEVTEPDPSDDPTAVLPIPLRSKMPSQMPSLFEKFVGELTIEPPEEPHEPHHSWMATTAKVTGLAVGSLVLCGSVMAAAALTHGHRADASNANSGDTVLTGVNALRPDDLAAQLSGLHTPSSMSSQALRPVAHGRATGTIVGSPATRPSRPVAPQASTSAPVDPAPVVDAQSAEDVVRSFYSLVASQPDAAAQLVDPSLLASDPTGFARSWSDTSEVHVESTKTDPDGTVQAVISLRQPDGALLRVVELLHVTLGDNPVINGAELLSAQRG
jgi:hypothetical protein